MFNKYEYDQKYIKDNYCRISLALPKKYKSLIRDAAKEDNLSVTAFIKNAIDKELSQR